MNTNTILPTHAHLCLYYDLIKQGALSLGQSDQHSEKQARTTCSTINKSIKSIGKSLKCKYENKGNECGDANGFNSIKIWLTDIYSEIKFVYIFLW